jgi:hypothetical protein
MVRPDMPHPRATAHQPAEAEAEANVNINVFLSGHYLNAKGEDRGYGELGLCGFIIMRHD